MSKEELLFADDEVLFVDEEDVEGFTEDFDESGYWNILIVDDDLEVHHVTKMVLSDLTFEKKRLRFFSAYTGREGLQFLQKEEHEFAVILLDVVMEDDHSGLELVKEVRQTLQNRESRIVIRTGQPGQAPERKVILDYDINDYREKTELTVPKLYTTMISALRGYRDIMTIKLLNKEIQHTQKEIIFTLGEIAETRSQETSYHVKRVAEYSKLLATHYGLPEEEAEVLRLAATMHDVGKVGIPDSILNKPARLSGEEFEVMKTHTTLGFEMLRHSSQGIIKAASVIAFQHHEKYNGTGYPQGLKGEEIHLYARITAIADVFDALGSNRVYKKAWELDKILELLKNERGEHFDPLLVDLFFEHLEEFISIRDAFS